MTSLSKSRYVKFRKCPRALWLSVFRRDAAAADKGLQSRFAVGHEVGELAKKLFGAGIDVTERAEDGSPDLGAMLKKTRECLDAGTELIYEASFSAGGCFCSADILRRTDGGYALYEVKSTSFPEFNGARARLDKYAPDIAYQKWVLEQAGVPVTGTYLVCLNSDYVRGETLDLQKLFAVISMDDLITDEYAAVPAGAAAARKVLEMQEEPAAGISERCPVPYPCEFWEHCTADLPGPSVFDLYRMPFANKIAAYRKGIVGFGDALSLDLTPM